MTTTKTTHTEECIEDCIEVCNKLLRGERSAVETYKMAIDRFGDDQRLAELRDICEEHRRSVSDLESSIRGMGGIPGDDSGAWGAFAKAVQGSANLFGKESAVESLQHGEEKGREDYEDALEGDDLLPGCRTLYSTTLLPRVVKHIATLERLEERVD